MPVTINGSGPVTGVTAITGAGLDLITTQTFSAASSVSVNNCFSATYENYRIVLWADLTSGSSIAARLRVSGADDSNAVYDVAGAFGGTSSGNATNNSQTSWAFNVANTTVKRWTADVFRPFVAAPTTIIGSLGETSNSTATYWYSQSLHHRNSTSFDGITAIFGATASGTLRVYGYRNS